ncbi:MAG TPA: hypothetical protein VJ302_19835 [Blastocatellia bacterium]|nr:hypothetical protein [Blastocatellia bacterium]
MKAKNGNGDRSIELIDCNGLIDEPDITIYEITIKCMFYQPPKQEVIDYIELSAEDVVLMFNQFKAGGFIPLDCRIILNTALKKEYLSSLSKGGKDE